ncbi:MAG: hypothetical protein AAGA84_04575 [Pseudomonadota bacterium]
MTYALDEATQLESLGGRRYALRSDKRFWNMRSMFGGWSAAASAQAVMQDEEFRGDVLTQTVNFQSAIVAENLVVQVRLSERRRALDYWQVDIAAADTPDETQASVLIVSGTRNATERSFEIDMPAHRAAADSFRLPSSESTPNWFSHFDIRLAKGRPFSVNPTPNSVTYVREEDGRTLDSKALLAIADTPMPRTFFVSEEMVVAATITLSTHIYASPQMLADVGNDFVMLDTQSKTIRDSLINQETHLFSPMGRLLAASYQTAYFRET